MRSVRLATARLGAVEDRAEGLGRQGRAGSEAEVLGQYKLPAAVPVSVANFAKGAATSVAV